MRKTRRTWSSEEKKHLASEARRLRLAGEPFSTICRSLGVLEGSLRLWMDQYQESDTLQPVQIIGVAPQPADEEADLITVIAPDGFRFETMTVASALRIWEAIRCSA